MTVHYQPGNAAQRSACRRWWLGYLQPAEFSTDPAEVSCGLCLQSCAYRDATPLAQLLTVDELRTTLSEAASRETAAVRAFEAAKAELAQAQAHYRATRAAFDAAYQAVEFDRTNPPLFEITEED